MPMDKFNNMKIADLPLKTSEMKVKKLLKKHDFRGKIFLKAGN
jgi:hypothetical protein